MGRRFGSLATFVVVLAAGAMLGSAFAQYWKERATVEPDSSAPAASLGRIRVEIRNAGGRGGMARAATDRLRDLGFDVVYFGNADRFGAEVTEVVDRVGRLDKARAVAHALGTSLVRSEPDEELYLDVTVYLGSDWEAGPTLVTEESSTKPWWDLRRWLRAPADGTASDDES